MAVFGGSPQVEADRYLIPFKTYEDYLNSLVQPIDLLEGRSTFRARCVAQFGYRARGEVLTRSEFEVRAEAARELDNPIRHESRLSSEGILGSQMRCKVDPFVFALAQRENLNRRSIVHTIIYLCVRKRTGEYVSAYVDYSHRLRHNSWTRFFHEGKLLRPKTSDLCYYNWHTTFTSYADSENYRMICNQNRGLIFQSVWDGKKLCMNPALRSPGPSTTRTRISSPNYVILVLYDHKLRRVY